MSLVECETQDVRKRPEAAGCLEHHWFKAYEAPAANMLTIGDMCVCVEEEKVLLKAVWI